MIVGNGDIASVLRGVDRSDRTFFASGVSNSMETREDEYTREVNLLKQQDRNKQLVYFSTLSLFYSNGRYQKHKRYMEELVKDLFSTYTIVRLGNITWGDNPNTFLNYFRNKIKNGEAFVPRDEYRYIIDKEEFLHWINLIPYWSCEMNIPGNRMKVADIIEKYGYVDIHSK